ncbi:MAG: hypothetical protein ACI9UK_000120 [Candidatus Krumholzibacteriia bacterium]|jgi:hypothetical protein
MSSDLVFEKTQREIADISPEAYGCDEYTTQWGDLVNQSSGLMCIMAQPEYQPTNSSIEIRPEDFYESYRGYFRYS